MTDRLTGVHCRFHFVIDNHQLYGCAPFSRQITFRHSRSDGVDFIAVAFIVGIHERISVFAVELGSYGTVAMPHAYSGLTFACRLLWLWNGGSNKRLHLAGRSMIGRSRCQ